MPLGTTNRTVSLFSALETGFVREKKAEIPNTTATDKTAIALTKILTIFFTVQLPRLLRPNLH